MFQLFEVCYSILYGITALGSRLCTFQWNNSSRCKATKHYSPIRKWTAIWSIFAKWRSGRGGEKVTYLSRIMAHRLGIGRVLYSRERIQCSCRFAVLQISRASYFPARLRLFAWYVFGRLFPWIDGMIWAIVANVEWCCSFLDFWKRASFQRRR